MNVLLTTDRGADDRKSVAAVRALAKSGVRCSVGSDSRLSPPLWSRYCRERVHLPSPATDPAGHVESVLRFMARSACEVLIPSSDYTNQALMMQRPRIETATRVALPSGEAMATASDKLKTIELAASLGIGVPRTLCPADRDELERSAADFDYPCVLKLRRGAGGVGMSFPASAGELMRDYDALDTPGDAVFTHERPLLQEFVSGPVLDASALFCRGAPRTVITRRRVVMHPPAGGFGVEIETTDEQDVRDATVRLLRALEWHGPANVEFRRDEHDGRLRLMEINARLWGALAVDIAAGVNFPLMIAMLARDGDVAPVTAYRVGVRYRWTWPYAWSRSRQEKHPLRALLRDLRPRPGMHSEPWMTDPLPQLLRCLLPFG